MKKILDWIVDFTDAVVGLILFGALIITIIFAVEIYNSM
jgi:VanZ family protein